MNVDLTEREKRYILSHAVTNGTGLVVDIDWFGFSDLVSGPVDFSELTQSLRNKNAGRTGLEYDYDESPIEDIVHYMDVSGHL